MLYFFKVITCATWIAWLELRSHILHCLSVDAVNTFVPSCNYFKQDGVRQYFFINFSLYLSQQCDLYTAGVKTNF